MLCTKTNQVWKHFQENPLSHSEAHYLMTIHETKKPHASDLAKSLEVSAPTVSQAIKTLVKKGWVIIADDKELCLSSNAQEVVTQIIKNKAMMMDFFVNFLGVEKSIADADSCKIEHLLSPEVGQAMEVFLRAQREQKKASGLPIIK